MRTPDPVLIARMVKVLRKSKRPVPGRDLCERFGVSRLRTWGECARAARLRGIPIVYSPGLGYRYARSSAERRECAARMRRAARAELRAADALERGRVPQTTAAPLRKRRAA